MAHIYGHSWPVRWGNEGEEKMIKVYSNCATAELFINGKSYGIKNRNSQDFPAAGLRWNVVLKSGKNVARVVAKKNSIIVEDSISFEYQAQKWGKPAKLLLEKLKEVNGAIVLQAKLVDENNVVCLDASNWIRFGVTGDGRLVDNLGTSSGSKYVQLYNGRAVITINTKKGSSVASAQVAGVETVFINL